MAKTLVSSVLFTSIFGWLAYSIDFVSKIVCSILDFATFESLLLIVSSASWTASAFGSYDSYISISELGVDVLSLFLFIVVTPSKPRPLEVPLFYCTIFNKF